MRQGTRQTIREVVNRGSGPRAACRMGMNESGWVEEGEGELGVLGLGGHGQAFR